MYAHSVCQQSEFAVVTNSTEIQQKSTAVEGTLESAVYLSDERKFIAYLQIAAPLLRICIPSI
jgi:hypothetical protein